MGAESLTIIYPPINPAISVRVEYLDAYGGVYSAADNLTSITVKSGSFAELTATLEQMYDEQGNLAVGQYTWRVPNVRLVLGANTLTITANYPGGSKSISVSLFSDFIAPTLTAAFPPNGTTWVSPVYQIKIKFSEPMDVASCLQGITLTPDAGGQWEYYPHEPTNAERVFVYAMPLGYTLAYNTKYTISFSELVTDKIGNPTTSTAISFTTKDAPASRDGAVTGYSFYVPAANKTLGSLAESGSANYTTITPGIASPFRYARMDGALSYNVEQHPVYYPVANTQLKDLAQSGTSVYNTITPGIASPFRYARMDGALSYDVNTHSVYNSVINAEPLTIAEAASTKFVTITPGIARPFRDARLDGATTGYYFFKYNVDPLPWYPVILSYNINNFITKEGIIYVMNGNIPIIEWNTPNAMRSRRIFYTVQFSRFPSFTPMMAFDSHQSRKAFKYSVDSGTTWEDFPEIGIKRKIGRTKFTSPAEIEGGRWFFRIVAGYKR